MPRILVFLTVFIPSICLAQCISDLYSAGLSFDSFSYELRPKDRDSKANIASDKGAGIKIGKIIYCPEKNREYYLYYRGRYFSLKEAKGDFRFRNLDSDIFLSSIGLDTRFILDAKKEILLDVEGREEYRPTHVVGQGFSLEDGRYLNLKALAGLRYFIKSNRTEDYTASIKAGPLVPIDAGNVETGFMGEVNMEYFRRISRNYSIRADLYLIGYSQDVDHFEVSGHELGLRYNYLFRY